MAFLAILSMLLCAGTGTEAFAQEKDYAILIVGDQDNAEMLRQENVLINEMGKRIRKQSPSQRLPIYSYHFNKQRERAYCENKLNVLSEDLLFVGIVQLENKVPLKVVFRVDRIANPSRAAKDILDRAEEIVGEASTPPPTTPTPTPSETPQPQVTPDESTETPVSNESGTGFRIQLGSFAQLKYAQDKKADVDRADLKVSVVEAPGPDGDSLYKVLSPLYTSRAMADEMLEKFREAGFEEAFLVRVGE